jgi:hypothetical protein
MKLRKRRESLRQALKRIEISYRYRRAKDKQKRLSNTYSHK